MPCSLVEPATFIFMLEERTTWETFLSRRDDLWPLQFMWLHGGPKILALFQNLCQTYLYINSYTALNALTPQDYGYAQPPNSVLHWAKKCLKPALLSSILSLIRKSLEF